MAYWVWHKWWDLYFSVRARIKGNAARVAIGNHGFLYDLRDRSVGRILYLFHQYERNELAFVTAQLRPGMTFVDIGANTGCYTLLSSRLVGAKGTVLAFEAAPENARILRANVAANGLQNVRIVEKAISDRQMQLLVHLSRINPGDHRTYDGRDDRSYNVGRRRRTVPVEGISLDAYLEDNPMRVDLIKMDIQGMEHLALRGMMNTLAANEAVILMTEYWPHGLEAAGSSPREYIEDLIAQRFRLYFLGDNGRPSGLNSPELGPTLSGDRHTTLVCSRRDLAS
jgi:FkbM family methyltransferase